MLRCLATRRVRVVLVLSLLSLPSIAVVGDDATPGDSARALSDSTGSWTSHEECLCNGCLVAHLCYNRASHEWCVKSAGKYCSLASDVAKSDLLEPPLAPPAPPAPPAPSTPMSHTTTPRPQRSGPVRDRAHERGNVQGLDDIAMEQAKDLTHADSLELKKETEIESAELQKDENEPETDRVFRCETLTNKPKRSEGHGHGHGHSHGHEHRRQLSAVAACPADSFHLVSSEGVPLSPPVCCRHMGLADREVEAVEELKEEEEEGAVNGVELIAAIMLLGSVTFVMSMFYLVNHKDEDIRKHSWNVISTTLSIFTAVLMFQGFDGFMDKMMGVEKKTHTSGGKKHGNHEVGDATLITEVAASYCLFLLTFAILQSVIAILAFKKSKDPDMFMFMDMDEDELITKDQESILIEFKKQQLLVMKSWAMLCSHICGFGAIHAGAEICQLEFFRQSMFTLVVCVLMQAGALFSLFQVSDSLRHWIGHGPEVELWDEVNEDAENDIASLSISYLWVFVLRMCIHDAGPHPVHNKNLPCILFIASGCASAGTVVMVITYGKVSPLLAPDGIWNRMLLQCQMISAMCFSWCMYAAAQAAMAQMPPVPGVVALDVDPHGVPMTVMLASSLSLVGFSFIFVLDFIADLDATGATADRVIANMIFGIGILVGFSWEHAFEVSVEVIAELTEEKGEWWPTNTKLCLALTLAAGIVPAWRKHILIKAIEHEVERHARNSVAKRTGSMIEMTEADMVHLTNAEYAKHYAKLPTTDPEKVGLLQPTPTKESESRVQFDTSKSGIQQYSQ